jgi:hypothetical protein
MFQGILYKCIFVKERAYDFKPDTSKYDRWAEGDYQGGSVRTGYGRTGTGFNGKAA